MTTYTGPSVLQQNSFPTESSRIGFDSRFRIITTITSSTLYAKRRYICVKHIVLSGGCEVEI